MQYPKPSNAALTTLLHSRFPAAKAAGSLSLLPGSSGHSLRLEWAGIPLVARRDSGTLQAGVSLSRHYRALKRLTPGLGPRPYALGYGWLITEFIPGDVTPALPDASALAGLLYTLHHQQRFGWRISLLPLLMSYWQHSNPDRRTPLWLRTLRRLSAQGEPQPLRLAPLHMDLHAGNIVRSADSLRLIDWEYAGDGDVALEIAAASMDEDERASLVRHYAHLAALDPHQLRVQVARWRPWTLALMAGWYERHYGQTRDRQFLTLANEAWNRLENI
ncbi:thiamine kinase [Atlantibacter hermannii]|uniref:thiamine kinase n=1 Tax=Atlantibacter hermannii TaxID=565 RepID=UPI0028B015AD|nr:thiamine kinase [Atlantibacter hermannii]